MNLVSPDESPRAFAEHIREMLSLGYLNIVGGCCGTTPEHVRALVQLTNGVKPRTPRPKRSGLRLSGLEALTISPQSNFVNVGERTNVTGSRKFAKLVLAGNLEAAVAVARDQVEGGAQIIDINFDEAMLDSEATMVRYLNLLASEPDIAKLPFMLDSSKWSVIEAGLKCFHKARGS